MLIDGIKIKGITSDFRKVKEDYVFVAITEEVHDGNNFIDLAIQKGATIIYTELDIYKKNCIVKRVENTRRILAELYNEFYDYPSDKFFVIGVTGTRGKTRIANLIHHIINRYGIKSGVISSLDIKINEKKYPLESTNLATEDIYYYLNRMVDEGIKVVVMEVSSYGLECETVYGIKFDIAIYTNIRRSYPDFNKIINLYYRQSQLLD